MRWLTVEYFTMNVYSMWLYVLTFSDLCFYRATNDFFFFYTYKSAYTTRMSSMQVAIELYSMWLCVLTFIGQPMIFSCSVHTNLYTSRMISMQVAIYLLLTKS